MAIFNTQYRRIEEPPMVFGWWSPEMTGATTPTPYSVTASGQYDGGSSGPGDPWRAFDGSFVSGSRWYVRESSPWIQFDFGSSDTIDGVGIQLDGENVEYRPKTFSILGSDDGTNWTEIKNGLSCESTTKRQEFMFSQVALYRYYRLSITNTNPCIIAEITFHRRVVASNG